MLAGRALLRSFSSLNAGVAVNVARFATTASSAAQAPSPNAQPAIKSTFVTVSNGGIVEISQEQYQQLNARPHRMSKGSVAFSSALLAALAAGGFYVYQNWEEEPIKSKRDTAAAHSHAAWERLKDAFTLSDSPAEVIDSDSSLAHKVKVGWNNGVRSFRDTVRELFEK